MPGVHGINFARRPSGWTPEGQAPLYANKRAEMWGNMRDWLSGGMLDDDKELAADLTSVEYGYATKDGRDCILLEKKEHMKKRGLASPDDADALALTFAHPVAPVDQRHKYGRSDAGQHVFSYDPLI